ncbi:MAG: hypothetical protein H6721_14575 [Sandaracinus sp.]|nr:hypothetical protein [Sandaracinus sp.]
MRVSIFALVLGLGCGGATATTPGPSSPAVTTVAPTAALPVDPSFVDATQVRVDGALPPLPIGLTSFGLASLGDDLYLLGGYHGEPHRYEAAGQSADLWVLREGASVWERGPSLELGLQSVALVRVGQGLHRVGGMKVEGGVGGPNGDGDGSLRSVADHARFDAARGAWESLPPLPESRSSHDAIALGDDLYVVGGWRIDGAPTNGAYADSMLRFRDGAWEALDQPFRRRALAVAATSRHLIAIGGLGEGGVSQRVDVFDATSGEWSRGPDFPGAHTGFGVAAIASGDAVLASGNDGVLRRWQVGEDTWTDVGRLAFPRFFHRLATLEDGSVVAVGGIGGMHTHGRTRVVERMNADGSAPRAVLFELPWSGEAKNRQGMFVRGDHLYFFGGNDSLGQHDFDAEHFVDEGWRVHLPSLRVERRASYPVPRQTMSTIEVGEHAVYSLAGFGHAGPNEPASAETVAHTHPEIFAYDDAADVWTLRATLPVPRSQLAVAIHEGTLFVMGGLDYDPRRAEGDPFRHLTEIVALDEGATELRTLQTAMPGGRRAFGHATHDGRWYVVGGMREEFQLVEECATFDFATERFEPLVCPRAPRLNPQLVNVDGKLVLVGGTTRLPSGELGEDRSIEVFDPATGTWSVAEAELPFTPKHAQAFAWNGRLLVVSTHDESDVLRLALLDV